MIPLSIFNQHRLLEMMFPGLSKTNYNKIVPGFRYEIIEISAAGTFALFQDKKKAHTRNNNTSGKLGRFYAYYMKNLIAPFKKNDGAPSVPDLAKVVQGIELECSVSGQGYLGPVHGLPFVTPLGGIGGVDADTTGNDLSYYPMSLSQLPDVGIPYTPDEEIDYRIHVKTAPSAAIQLMVMLHGPEAHSTL